MFASFLRAWRASRQFHKQLPARREIVFYAESESYWPYLGPIMEYLAADLGRPLSYLTSSETDPRLRAPLDNTESFFVGDGTVRTALFAALQANLLVTTMPGIGTSYIRRSQYPVHYVHLPHNMTSTHMVFPKHAFNGFDTLFCTGPHQIAEHRKAETLYNLPPRQLIAGGYVRFDDYVRRREAWTGKLSDDRIQVLIAPSWTPGGLITNGCAELIEALHITGIRVVLRPHRDSIRHDAAALAALGSRFDAHPDFSWANEMPGDTALLNSHILITDWSGSAFSFTYAFERPVLFIDLPAKVNNPDFREFAITPVESRLRNDVGKVISPADFHMAGDAVTALWKDREIYRRRIIETRPQVLSRSGDAVAFAAETIAGIAAHGPMIK